MKAFVICLFITCLYTGCGKSGGSSTPAVEPALVFTTNPDPGSTIFTALSSNQDVAVTVTSKMPAAGVTADITVIKEMDNSTIFSQSLSSSLPNFTLGIQNLSGGAVCDVTITLTSKTTVSNKASKTFKIAKK